MSKKIETICQIISGKHEKTWVRMANSLRVRVGAFQPSSSGTKKTLIMLVLLLFPMQALAIYDIPNNDGDCPDNCRQIPWSAGSDQWNGGTLPNYTSVTCTGLTEGDGTTNNASAIQTCLDNLSSGEAAYIPPGIYYVNGIVEIDSNKVLRGAKPSTQPYLPTADPTQTTLKLGSSGYLRHGSGASKGSERNISSGYTKGSTTLNMASGHSLSTNDWIVIFEDGGDSEIPVTWTGSIGNCTWCGESNNSNHLMSQFAKVTNVAGNTITISRPMYYTFKSGLDPAVKEQNWGAQYAGIENLRIHGWADPAYAMIYMRQTLFSWVKGVETYNAGSGSKEAHIRLEHSHGAEIRDSYFHRGRNSSSDRNYGIALFFSNSDHKIENNILRHHRHSVNFEGGGSGSAVLYNYMDDNYTDDTTYLGSSRFNHGAHPYMNIFEGNIISHITADRYWGSSSHFLIFRNWLWGDETWTDIPGSLPNSGYLALDIWSDNNYYTVVGNVLGITGLHTNWSNATLRSSSANPWAGPNAPVIYGFGDSAASTTSINHGNYDYKTQGVAYWEGGADHDLKDSYYYDSKPSWWDDQGAGRPWPSIGPDISGYVIDIPAKDRYEGETYSSSGAPPLPPKNLSIVSP